LVEVFGHIVRRALEIIEFRGFTGGFLRETALQGEGGG
jgi:hypothetical protein